MRRRAAAEAGAHVELTEARIPGAARPFARDSIAARMRSRRRYSYSSVSLQAASDAPVQNAQRALDPLLPQTPFQHRQTVAHDCVALARAAAMRSSSSWRVQTTISAAAEGGGAQVGHEIGDGDVGLVAHGRDHRHGTGGDGARHGLFVEGPQIFERAAAAAHNDDVRPPDRLKYWMPRQTSSTEPSPCTSAG